MLVILATGAPQRNQTVHVSNINHAFGALPHQVAGPKDIGKHDDIIIEQMLPVGKNDCLIIRKDLLLRTVVAFMPSFLSLINHYFTMMLYLVFKSDTNLAVLNFP